MRIVIIEDDPAIRQELTVLLQNALYEVTAPDEFDDAASAALSASPDLILLDVKLPGESGFDICSNGRGRLYYEAVSSTDSARTHRGSIKENEKSRCKGAGQTGIQRSRARHCARQDMLSGQAV